MLHNRLAVGLSPNHVMSDVTKILSQIETGDPTAPEQLLPHVSEELRKLAVAKLLHQKLAAE